MSRRWKRETSIGRASPQPLQTRRMRTASAIASSALNSQNQSVGMSCLVTGGPASFWKRRRLASHSLACGRPAREIDF